MSKTVKELCINAMGIVLFVVLSFCIQVPVFENYYLCLGYIAMAVYCYCFGPVSGTIVGALGVVIYCLLINGLRGMPGWALGNVVVGIAAGLAFYHTKSISNNVARAVINIAAVIISTAVGMLGIKSITECILYAQPFLLRSGKNFYAFAADAAVLLISLPLCRILEPQLSKILKTK